MKNTHKISIVSIFALMFGFTSSITAFAATTPDLGAAATYGILSDTFNNTSATTIINGDIGFTTFAGLAPGGTNANFTPAAAAGAAQATALAALSAGTNAACDVTFAAGAIDLGIDHSPEHVGTTYTPGVYCIDGAMSIDTSPITFSGAGTYIFRSTGAFTTSAGMSVILVGASACDIFWNPNGLTSIGANNFFQGTVIPTLAAAHDITVLDATSWTGRALTFAHTITLPDTNVTITVPTCTPPPATLHIIKQVVNTGGGTATAATFNLHVKLAGADVAGSPAIGTATPGTSYSLSAGAYVVSEDANALYTRSFGGACDANGNVSLLSGDDKTCTVTNTYIIPPPVSSGGGGGNLRVDVCPEGDYSYSYYDGICGTAPIVADRIVPLIGIIKVPAPLALPAGSGSVTYNYVVWNVGGKQALTSVSIADDKCSTVKLLSGDINNNQKLDPTEKWKYSCTSTLLATTTNTAVASGYGDDTYRQLAVATAVATVVVGAPLTPPLISIVKVPSRLTPFSFGGGDVTYTYTVRNPWIVAMHDVVVTDDKCAPVAGPVGDTNRNNLFETTETWVYTCRTNVPVSTMNTATAKGQANGFTAISHAFANVLVSPAVIAKITPRLPNTGLPQKEASIPWNVVALASILMLASASLLIAFRKRNI